MSEPDLTSELAPASELSADASAPDAEGVNPAAADGAGEIWRATS